MSDQPRGPEWWLASDGKWYSPRLKPQPPEEPSYVAGNDPRPWALGAVFAGWFALFTVLYLGSSKPDANGSTDTCVRAANADQYQQCAHNEETFILNFHSIAVALGTFGLIFAMRGIRHKGLDREVERPTRLTVSVALAALLVATTILWRVLGNSRIVTAEQPFESISSTEVAIRIGLGFVIGGLLGLLPLKRVPQTPRP